MSIKIKADTITPGEARWDTDDHEHEWFLGNNILGPPFAECGCGATAELDSEDTPT